MSRRAAIGLLAGLAAVAAAVPAHAGPAAPDVPALIRVEAGHKPFLIGHATGVQIHACRPAGDGHAWTPVAPRADIHDASGHRIMTHYGGPAWEARDGSVVRARRDEGVTVDPSAIQWLRLAVTSATAGPDGDRLAGTTFIQRIATAGGLPPAPATCHAGSSGAVQEVPYTADYVFYKRSPARS